MLSPLFFFFVSLFVWGFFLIFLDLSSEIHRTEFSLPKEKQIFKTTEEEAERNFPSSTSTKKWSHRLTWSLLIFSESMNKGRDFRRHLTHPKIKNSHTFVFFFGSPRGLVM